MTPKKSVVPQPVKSSESLGDDAYEWLIAAITSFQIPTNSQISENKLAAELGVSRTPVREALMRLESEGLVKRSEAGRFTVAMLTGKDVDEAIDLMVLCDIYMFQRATKSIDNAGAVALLESAKNMTKCAKYGDRDGWMKYDKIFHETIMRAANNDMLKFLESLADEFNDSGLAQLPVRVISLPVLTNTLKLQMQSLEKICLL